MRNCFSHVFQFSSPSYSLKLQNMYNNKFVHFRVNLKYSMFIRGTVWLLHVCFFNLMTTLQMISIADVIDECVLCLIKYAFGLAKQILSSWPNWWECRNLNKIYVHTARPALLEIIYSSTTYIMYSIHMNMVQYAYTYVNVQIWEGKLKWCFQMTCVHHKIRWILSKYVYCIYEEIIFIFNLILCQLLKTWEIDEWKIVGKFFLNFQILN